MRSITKAAVISVLIGIFFVPSIGHWEDPECDCYPSHGQVWRDCDLYCMGEESYCRATGNWYTGCHLENCAILWRFICQNGEEGEEWYETDCPEDCEPPAE